MSNRAHLKLSIAAPSDALDNDTKITLQRQVIDLEAVLANIRKEAKSNEEALLQLLKEKQLKQRKLINNLAITERERVAVERRLKCVQDNQQIKNVSTQ